MTFKVLIVDDEAVARIGLSSSIPWEKGNFRLAGEAGDGKKALDLIERESPDIVITDIVMPVVDGLELMRRARALPSPPRFVVLSAYDDFPKVREAMKLGAVDYLLKPEARPRAILALLRSVAAGIERERAGGSGNRREREEERAEPLRRNLLRDVIAGYYAADKDFREALVRLGMRLSDSRILCATIKIGETYRFEDLSDEDLDSLNRRVVGVVEAILGERRSAYRFEVRTGEFSALMSYSPLPQASGLCARAVEMIKQYLNMSAIIGIGEGTLSIQGVRAAHAQAALALRNRFLEAGSAVLTCRNTPPVAAQAVDYSPIGFRDRLDRALLLHDRRDIGAVFDRIIDDLSKLHLGRDALRSVALELYCMICELLFRNGIQHAEVLSRSGRPSAHLLYLDSLAEVRAWLDLLREDLLHFVRAEEERNYPRVIARAKRFIEQHHAKELTLAMVAKDAALNASYFSTLFKHHSGEGFTSYLTRVRIEAAKELLRTTDLKVYEVAERVGYQNQYHFSRVFKRMTGLTPGELRNSCG